MRTMPLERSFDSSTAVGKCAQKLGQPVPLSYLVFDEKSDRRQPTQAKMPARCSFNSGLVNGASVASCRSTAYASGLNSLRHSASVWMTS